MKFHLSDDGVARKCVATVRPCTLEHYETKDDANKAFEDSMKEKVIISVSQKAKADIESAAVSLAYGKFNVENQIIHNTSKTITDGELTYYSSKQGRLELKRRIFSKPDNAKFKLIDEKINHPNFSAPELAINENDFNDSVDRGFAKISKNFKDVDKTFFEAGHLRDKDIMNALVDSSHKWMSSLTTEQQEAISFSTSNGFLAAQYAEGMIDERGARNALNNLIITKEEAINENEHDALAREMKAKDEAAKKFNSIYKSAFKDAPKFNEPIIIYRGTSIGELRDILGYSKDKDAVDTAMELLSGAHTGKLVHEDARLSRIPESASVSAGVTQKFTDYDANFSVSLEIKQASATTPVNVSDWGIREFEVLTNPTSKYRIKGARLLESTYKEKALVVELEEVFEA